MDGLFSNKSILSTYNINDTALGQNSFVNREQNVPLHEKHSRFQSNDTLSNCSLFPRLKSNSDAVFYCCCVRTTWPNSTAVWPMSRMRQFGRKGNNCTAACLLFPSRGLAMKYAAE
jgi:ABC-type maltose transport system permease subunit